VLKEVFGWLDDEYDKIPVERAVLDDPELPGTVLRLPMVYGPGDPLHRFFPLVKRIADGRKTISFSQSIAQWRATRGFVENVGAAIALAVTSDQAAGKIYNVGEPDALSELEWGRLLTGVAGWSGELRVLPDDRAPAHLLVPANTAQHWIADSTKIREELGYTEIVAREEALCRTLAWERAHPPAQFDPKSFDYAAEDAALGWLAT
jgi:nucleoside-diphosphate-sugar epimerase